LTGAVRGSHVVGGTMPIPPLSGAALPTALHAFLDAAPDAIVVADEAGRIVAVNALTERMFGYPHDELLGSPVEVLVPARLAAAHVRHRSQYARDPVTRPMGEGLELSGRRKDGSEFPIEISLSPLRTDAGLLVISMVRDTSLRREAEAKFRGLLESAPDGIVVVDQDGRIAIVNGAVERMFGYSRDDLVGQPVELLVPERYRGHHSEYRNGYFQHPVTRPMGAGRLLTGRKSDGGEFPVEISLSPLETSEGRLVTSIIRDVTDRRRAEEQLKASLREKEVLLKEIHHRVKNNLQITSSLLKLQSNYIRDPDAQEMFDESQNRIRSMALVHEKLYQARDLSRVDFAEYAKSLAALLFRSYGVDRTRIELVLKTEELPLPIDVAVPCGLILNELVSNCLKHAFPPGSSGHVTIAIERGRDRAVIAVGDDGIGLPAGLVPERTDTLGLQLVHTLADQLHARLEFERQAGTRVRLTLVEAGS
jgi:PAS domain S-box-containing protein